jgi:hypothetical protein
MNRGVLRVIVGASGSPGSLQALRYAQHLARDLDATLVPRSCLAATRVGPGRPADWPGPPPAYGVGVVGPQHPQAVAQTLCSITRTLARLARSRGANWGANDARCWATPGHSQLL